MGLRPNLRQQTFYRQSWPNRQTPREALDKYPVPVNLSDWIITMEASSSIDSLNGPAKEMAGFSNSISTANWPAGANSSSYAVLIFVNPFAFPNPLWPHHLQIPQWTISRFPLIGAPFPRPHNFTFRFSRALPSNRSSSPSRSFSWPSVPASPQARNSLPPMLTMRPFPSTNFSAPSLSSTRIPPDFSPACPSRPLS